MNHQLIVEHRSGCYEARCSCGVWREEPVRLRVGQVRELFWRVQPEHHRHVQVSQAAESGKSSPARPKAGPRPHSR
jgi:hypothetical protein